MKKDKTELVLCVPEQEIFRNLLMHGPGFLDKKGKIG